MKEYTITIEGIEKAKEIMEELGGEDSLMARFRQLSRKMKVTTFEEYINILETLDEAQFDFGIYNNGTYIVLDEID